MTIEFNQIPDNLRVPGPYVEFDNSQAIRGLAQQEFKILIIGQRLNTGSVAEGVPVLVTSKANAIDFFGRGSNLALMISRLFDNNNFTELWAVALNDHGSAVDATGSFAVTGSATEDGVITMYIGGKKVEASVTSGDAATAIGDAIEAAINADGDLPVTASNTTGTVTLTARNGGTVGNDIPLYLNYRGALGGEKLPAGVAIAITQMNSGATDPDIDTAFAALPSEIYNVIVAPYTDATNLDKVDTELNSRHGPTAMLEGHYISAKHDSVANLTTLGNSRNNEHVTIFETGATLPPMPSYEYAAALAGKIAFSAANDPARPFTSLQLVNILAPKLEDRRTFTERNTLLFDGIATLRINRAGQVQIERGVTTYQLNSGAQPDASYLDSQTLFTLSYMRQTLRNRITQKFPRHKLADNGTRFGAGQPIVTPNIIAGEIIALAGLWEAAGLLEDMDNFKANLLVERDGVDANRVNAVIPPDVVNQFRIFAASLMFRL